ncbi:Proline dehydrogenase/ delta-1-pyrroline-5-carboxylate dehydrogenase [gamma proteobacterium HdN1]|nr:Proline dehydrogenase/ delta-1-pyrroline-5-carboxylate dehydrogenase [gamma proteobacterium HdN1]
MSASVNSPQSIEFPLGNAIREHHLMDEDTLLRRFLLHPGARLSGSDEIDSLTHALIEAIRAAPAGMRMESLLKEYSLDTQEGLSLMCLAEALLRIPDDATAERFVEERLRRGDWGKHLGTSDAFWVNASTWGLLMAGKWFRPSAEKSAASVPIYEKTAAEMFSSAGKILRNPDRLGAGLGEWFQRLSDPLALGAIRQAMHIMARQFVAGENMEDALHLARKEAKRGYFHSFDRLGEAAITATDVQHYLTAYETALTALANLPGSQRIHNSLSVKLSAFHPRFEPRQPEALAALRKNLLFILEKARAADVAVTIDAEESWRLEATLEIFGSVLCEPAFRRWGKLGLAVQAYQKRALPVLHWLGDMSRKLQCAIPVRLVKGAYWDSEIKWAQQQGLADYPVFTRKSATDLHYQLCARYLLGEEHLLYPQFATHNANTVATLMVLARQYPKRNFEFQRLHGMGEPLFDYLLATDESVRCRVYSPVGSFRELLPYLVRRLLENGANSSFVHQVYNEDIASLTRSPAVRLKNSKSLHNDQIVVPPRLFLPERMNSKGLAIEDRGVQQKLRAQLQRFQHYRWQADATLPVYSPANSQDLVGCYPQFRISDCERAMEMASLAQSSWRQTQIADRARILERIADQFEENRTELIALLIRESGKTVVNAIGEVREAVDFCRYYAAQALLVLTPRTLNGPTGESNQLITEGRGVFLCISPWNFPLAIFTGQIVAALVAGNCVLAKCASLTPLIAARAVQFMHQAGIPPQVLHYLPASASHVEHTLLSHPALAGVIFTGSGSVAVRINRALAQREGAILPLIAETGGLNAMLVDSTALPEQVVRDIAVSAFDSAGQRCSALRVLFLQEEIADRLLTLLKGHLETLRIGDPWRWNTDIGPAISASARDEIIAHISSQASEGNLLFQALPAADSHGYFIPPTVLKLRHLSELDHEIFGPVLHVIRYSTDEFDAVIRQINSCQFGLTFGVHTRLDQTWQRLEQEISAGNIYINRNMIGATVGVQPFGGRGLSGTGPKAGGPHYLLRLVHEKSISNNTSAIGGNAGLLSHNDD